MMKTKSPFQALLGTCALAACVSGAYATDLVNDTWKDQTRTDPASPVYSEQGFDADMDGNLESAWYLSNGGSLIPNGASPGDYILRTPQPSGSMGMTTYFTSNAPVMLSAAGEKLRVTWKFIPSGTATDNNTSQNFRLCVVDTDEAALARRTSDGQPGTGVYPGYAMFMNATTNLGGGYFQLRSRDETVTNAFLSSSGAWTTRENDQTGSAGIEGWIDFTEYTYVFEATLLSGGSLEIKSTVTGANIGGAGQLSLTYTDAAPATLAFDTFAVRPSNNTQTFTNLDTTLFKVEYIPAGCIPTAFNVTGGSSVCFGDTSQVGLDGSEAGYDYYLLLNSSPEGTVLQGNGSALDFGMKGVGSYTVYASNTTITCEGLMSGSAEIVEYALPNITSQPSPASAQNTFGDTRVFSITATGPGLTYQWRKDGFNLSNSATVSGVNTDTLTLSDLTAGATGSYDCVVSNSPCGESTTSQQATLNVTAGSGLLYRTVLAGPSLWGDPSAWESSANGGATWTTPVALTPSNMDSNILVRAGHTLWVQSPQVVDQVTIEAGATVILEGGSLTVNNGTGLDFNVLGNLQVGSSGGSITIGSATMQFGNGAVYSYDNPNAVAVVPTATWLDGSTCRITQAAAGLANGIGGQDYYDFILDTTAIGQSGRIRMNIQANTQVRRDFVVKVPDDTSSSTTINNGSNIELTVGRDVIFAAGTTSSGNKVLLHNAALPGFHVKIGRDFTATGYVDGFGSAETIFEFTGAGSHNLNMPIQPFIITSTAMNWLIPNGETVVMANHLDGFNTFTNKGTLTFGSNMIIRGTTLAFDDLGTVNANGTNTIVTNVNSFTAGGTLNLGAIPVFVGGESFPVVQAGSYSGTFSSYMPATPGTDLSWLYSDGILTASTGAPTPVDITFNQISGTQVELSWPDGQGWKLQAQTNALSTGLSGNWSEVVGATSPYTNTIDTANPAVFYRLIYP